MSRAPSASSAATARVGHVDRPPGWRFGCNADPDDFSPDPIRAPADPVLFPQVRDGNHRT